MLEAESSSDADVDVLDERQILLFALNRSLLESFLAAEE